VTLDLSPPHGNLLLFPFQLKEKKEEREEENCFFPLDFLPSLLQEGNMESESFLLLPLLEKSRKRSDNPPPSFRVFFFL